MRDVLVVQLARFGDIVQMKRLVLSVAAEDGVRVHLLVGHDLAALARYLYPEVIVHTFPAHATEGNDASAVAKVFTEAKLTLAELASMDFATVYILNASPLASALARMFSPERVVGYASVDGQPVQSQWTRLAKRFTRHRATSPLNLVDFWAYFHPDPIAPEKVNPIPRFAGAKKIGIVLAGQQARRSLPPEVLGPIVHAVWKAQDGPQLVLLGSNREKPLARALLQALPAKCVEKTEILAGKTSLMDMPDIVRGLDTLLTPDTGLMHLAAHCGTPVQAFFLSSAWCFETGPYGFGHKVWQAMASCAPCLETAPCSQNVACLNPFMDKNFLLYQSGQCSEDWPGGLCGLVGVLDPLGGTCRLVDGKDPHEEARAANRAFIGDYLGFGTSHLPAVTADMQYRERDWMLDFAEKKTRNRLQAPVCTVFGAQSGE